jgi:uncharacterized protein YecT (DUF1311 family)
MKISEQEVTELRKSNRQELLLLYAGRFLQIAASLSILEGVLKEDSKDVHFISYLKLDCERAKNHIDNAIECIKKELKNPDNSLTKTHKKVNGEWVEK